MKALKLSLLSLCLSMAMMSFVGKSDQTDPVVKAKSTSPIAWKAEMIEVGEIPQNKPKSIEFEFKNTGKTDVIITNVKPSCGCTAADYTKTPIRPGENGKVTATYNAAAKGAFTKNVTVTTNAEETPKVLTFKGTVI